MNVRVVLLLGFIGIAIAYTSGFAQETQTRTGVVFFRRLIDKNSIIHDKATGQLVSFEEYSRLMQAERNGYFLEAVYDAYGQESSYLMRPATAEERQTGRFRNDILVENRPKVGEPVPLFIMRAIDGNEYKSTDLADKIVVVSFWINLHKPLWSPQRADQLQAVLQPFQASGNLLSLGLLGDTPEDIKEAMKTQTFPFIPVPNSLGFNHKFGITSYPSFLVIDKTGTVAAFISDIDFDQLRETLKRLSQ